MSQNMENLPLLGGIRWNGQKKKFEIDQERPGFKSFITNYMNLPRVNRCHSVSFYLLSAVLCDLANNSESPEDFKAAVGYLAETFGAGVAGYPVPNENIPDKSKRDYLNQLDAYTAELQEAAENAVNGSDFKNELLNFLSHLNSCPFNLRYPSKPTVNWNQSVGDTFDPRMWCYVNEDGKVISDDTMFKLRPVSVEAYCRKRGLAATQVRENNGFYILNARDGYLLGRLIDMGQFLSEEYLEDPPLKLTQSIEDEIPYLASSSNMYPVKKDVEYEDSAYYWYLNQWMIFGRN